MAIKDQCLQCSQFNRASGICNTTGAGPVYDYRSCAFYHKKGINLNKPDDSTVSVPAPKPQPSRRQATPPSQKPQRKPVDRKKLGKWLLATALVLCIILGLLIAYATNAGLPLAFLMAAVFCTISAVVCSAGLAAKFITISLLTAGIIATGPFALKRYGNPEEYDFASALRKDMETSYTAFISQYPESVHNEACLDSIAAKKFNLIKTKSQYSYSISEHRLFIETCERPDIKQRAIRHLDDRYDEIINYTGYSKSENEKNKEAYKELYVTVYPDGPHYSEFREEMMAKLDEDAFSKACDELTVSAFQQYIKDFPKGAHVKDARQQIATIRRAEEAEKEAQRRAEEAKKYANNSLTTGSQPYANVYGRNSYSGNCAITVRAGSGTDVVVIVKRNNSNGRVVGHAYIRKGSSYTINLDPGTYQAFFYYGNGWNPNRKLSNGLTGGFTSNEQYGKDSPTTLSYRYSGDYIYYDQIEYSLQSVVGGNFRMSGSNAGDVF